MLSIHICTETEKYFEKKNVIVDLKMSIYNVLTVVLYAMASQLFVQYGDVGSQCSE